MRALVLSGAGLNCERETAAALQLAGFRSEIVHIVDLIAAPEKLKQAQLLALVGGFSYGDHMGAALVLAEQMRRLGDALQDFIARDTLILGICNGCQLLLRLELLANAKWAFRANQSGRYECRWVHVRSCLDTPFTRKGQIIAIPVAHAEGQLFGGDHQQISLAYCDQHGAPAQGQHPLNPNGAEADAAAISAHQGRILALMPHPERALFPWQHPQILQLPSSKTKNVPITNSDFDTSSKAKNSPITNSDFDTSSKLNTTSTHPPQTTTPQPSTIHDPLSTIHYSLFTDQLAPAATIFTNATNYFQT